MATVLSTGADPGFQVRGGGAHLKKLRRAEGGAKIFGVFRVKNYDFTPKNHIFSNFRGGARRVRPPLPGSTPGLFFLDLRPLNTHLVSSKLSSMLSDDSQTHIKIRTRKMSSSCMENTTLPVCKIKCSPGADPGFQVRGAQLKKLRRAEGDAKMFGVFRVKNPPLQS